MTAITNLSHNTEQLSDEVRDRIEGIGATIYTIVTTL